MSRTGTEVDVQNGAGSVPSADAFALIGNETRLSILEALWEADEQPMRFSELNEAVGMRDSAQFNYHLSKLTDQYIRKTDDGYELRTAGAKVVRAILAGSFT
jgi:DNA-binding transcriptional ArsR family regulator